MKLLPHWIRDFVDLKVDNATLAHDLTSIGIAAEGVSVHAVLLGPVDTDMNRGFDIPKASPESAVAGIFDGLANGEDEIFPDPASASIADAWRNGAVKAMEGQFAAFVPQASAGVA